MQNLHEWKQWICWGVHQGRKIPLDIYGNRSACNDSESFVTYAEAKGNTHGLGIAWCFTDGDPFLGIDLDKCFDSEHNLEPWAEEIIDRFSGTYCEVSPSGLGVKIFCEAVKPVGTVCQYRKNGTSLECYDRGRFFTVTESRHNGQLVTEQQAAVNWLADKYLRPVKESPKVRTPRLASGGGNGLGGRLTTYLEQCAYPVPGERNSTYFRIAGHLLSIEHHGEIPTVEAVSDRMRAWNAGAPHPLDESEVDRCCRNAATRGTPRELKPTDTRTLEIDDGVDVSGLLMEQKQEAEIEGVQYQEVSDDPLDVIDWASVPGVLGDLVRHQLAVAIYPQPELAFASSLALLSVLTGRLIEDSRRTRTNLMILGVAPTGAGKELGRAVNSEILKKLGMSRLVGSERIGSAAGVVSTLKQHPCTLMQVDEFGTIYSQSRDKYSAHLKQLASVLMQAYSSSNKEWRAECYSDASRNPLINEPHLVLYGTSTPASMFGALSSQDVSEGILGRMMLFEGGWVATHRNEMRPVPDAILNQLYPWAELHDETGGENGNIEAVTNGPTVRRIEYDEWARELLFQHLEAIARRRQAEEEARASIWSRSGENTAKLAMLLAISRMGTAARVTEDDVRSAIRISNYCTRKLVRVTTDDIADSESTAIRNKMVKMLKRDKKVRMRDLNKAARYGSSPSVRRDIVDELVREGLATKEATSGGGMLIVWVGK